MVLFDWLIVMMSLTVVVHQVNTALVPAKDLLQQEENLPIDAAVENYFHRSVLSGKSNDEEDEQFLQAAARSGFDISLQLIVAAGLGKTDYVFWLLNHGANVITASPNFQRTALMQAAAGGHVYLVKILEKGSNPNAVDWQEKTVLINAATIGDQHHNYVVKQLLQAGADVNHADPSGTTALIQAVVGGYSPMVQRLLNAGANVNAPRGDGQTALMLAAVNGYVDIVALLIGAGAAVNAKEYWGGTALIYAALIGNLEMVQILIEAGADVNAADYFGVTVLMSAAYAGNIDVVKILIEAGANVNAKNSSWWTAFFVAAWNGYDDIIKMFVAAGTDVNAVDSYGRTALMYVVQYGYVDTVKLLIAEGAYVNAATSEGCRPLNYAHGNKVIQNILSQAGAYYGNAHSACSLKRQTTWSRNQPIKTSSGLPKTLDLLK